MPRQLIYTSAPRGLTPGQSGYCTVARSRDLREALIPRLEKFGYYTPEAKDDPVICAHRIVELRGVRYHVLSRLAGAGLDFTKRRKFIAHHLIFEPDELASAPTPAWIFLKWNGWAHHWEGEPRWIEDFQSLPACEPEASAWRELTGSEANAPALIELARGDGFVTGGPEERKLFLRALHESLLTSAKPWEVTFTNYFQPGDGGADFQIKAVWPGRPGHEEAARLRDLRATPTREAAIPEVMHTPSAPVTKPEQPAPPPKTNLLWPMLAGAMTLLALVVAVFFRSRAPEKPAPTPSASSPPAASAPGLANQQDDLEAFFPNIPTWLGLAEDGALGPAAPVERLLQLLRDAELFGKDIQATLQTNPLARPVHAQVDARPRDNKILFRVEAIEFELSVAAGVPKMRSDAGNPVVLEINSQQRFLSVPSGAPIFLSRRFLKVATNTQIASLASDLETRLRRVVLPPGGQLALRPQDDPIARVESEFALLPATAFDLRAIRTQVRHVISAKEKQVETARAERASLRAAEKKLLTQGKTADDARRRERIEILELAVPKAAQELKELREKGALVPKNLERIECYSIFLCVSNVNTEIIRFGGEPSLARNASP